MDRTSISKLKKPKNKMSKETATTDTAAMAVVLNEKVNNVLAQNSKQLFEKAFVVSSAIVDLKQALSPAIMKPIMALQGNKLGFKTDKDQAGGYPEEVVKNCIIEATLSGLQVVGNQFNIIGGNMYGTKEGFGFLLKNVPGLHYEIIFELPRINQAKDGAAVVANLTWAIEGKPFKRKLDLAIKMNSYMGADAVIGKATRKARKWLYDTLTGTDIGEGDIQDVPHTIVEEKKTAEETKEAKVDERVLAMIESANSLQALEELKPHLKPEHAEAVAKRKIAIGKTIGNGTAPAAGGGTN